MLEEKHNGEIYELTGPRLWTFPQVVEEIAQATGREIQFTPISMEAYSNMLKEFGLPDDYIWLITYLFNEVLETAENQLITNGVERALGRKAKDLSDYVQETAKTGVWNVKQPIS